MKLLIFALLLITPSVLKAQLEVPFALYMDHPQFFNSSAVNQDRGNYNQLVLHMRNQWINFPRHPRTVVADYIHGWKRGQVQVLGMFDVVGTTELPQTRQCRARAGYSYRIALDSQTYINAGLSAGYWRMDGRFLSPLIDPPRVVRISVEWIVPEAGIWFQHSIVYGGVSVSQYIAINSIGGSGEPMARSGMNAIVGGRIPFSDNLDILPSTILYLTRPMPLYSVINVNLRFQNKYWMGVGFRPKISRSMMGYTLQAGMNAQNWLRLGFAFEYNPVQPFAERFGPSFEGLTAFDF